MSDYLIGAAALFQGLVACDDVFWMNTDFAATTFDVWRLSVHDTDPTLEAAMARMFGHPAIQSYLAEPSDLTPRRLADIGSVREPVDDSALELSRDLMGAHQLSVITHVDPVGRGRGWVLARDGSDFTAAEREAATQMLPILLAFDRVHGPSATPVAYGRTCRFTEAVPGIESADAAGPPSAWTTLTPRERQVVDLLVHGLTARAIGSRMGISPRTVGKHLEHIYEKLGRHDRLIIALERRSIAPGRLH